MQASPPSNLPSIFDISWYVFVWCDTTLAAVRCTQARALEKILLHTRIIH